MQILLVHDALHRQKAFVDCFFEGLEVHGLFSLIKAFPSLFEKAFISAIISSDDDTNSIHLPTTIDELEDRPCSLVLMLFNYLRELTTQG